MNRYFTSKRPALVLLLVMLLNPVFGFAGSLEMEHSMPLEMPAQNESMMMSSDHSEHCHEPHEVNNGSVADLSIVDASESCESICQCSQGHCHSPLAMISNTDVLVTSRELIFHASFTRYLSPTLISQNPPPII